MLAVGLAPSAGGLQPAGDEAPRLQIVLRNEIGLQDYTGTEKTRQPISQRAPAYIVQRIGFRSETS